KLPGSDNNGDERGCKGSYRGFPALVPAYGSDCMSCKGRSHRWPWGCLRISEFWESSPSVVDGEGSKAPIEFVRQQMKELGIRLHCGKCCEYVELTAPLPQRLHSFDFRR